MRKEVLWGATIATLAYLSTTAFSSRQKREIRKKQNGKSPEGKDIDEVHHKVPLHRGGKDVVENGVGLSLVEHAEAHYRLSRRGSRKHKKADSWAVRQIVRRMSHEEREEFNRRVNGR